MAAVLLGRDQVVLFHDNLVWKTPGAGPIAWHQDYSYQPVSAPVGVTTWLSLDTTTPDSGCLHYLPGTHRPDCEAYARIAAATPPWMQVPADFWQSGG